MILIIYHKYFKNIYFKIEYLTLRKNDIYSLFSGYQTTADSIARVYDSSSGRGWWLRPRMATGMYPWGSVNPYPYP